MDKHHILNDKEREILDSMKEVLTKGVRELKESGVRHANIEIELIWHVRDILKEE